MFTLEDYAAIKDSFLEEMCITSTALHTWQVLSDRYLLHAASIHYPHCFGDKHYVIPRQTVGHLRLVLDATEHVLDWGSNTFPPAVRRQKISPDKPTFALPIPRPVLFEDPYERLIPLRMFWTSKDTLGVLELPGDRETHAGTNLLEKLANTEESLRALGAHYILRTGRFRIKDPSTFWDRYVKFELAG